MAVNKVDLLDTRPTAAALVQAAGARGGRASTCARSFPVSALQGRGSSVLRDGARRAAAGGAVLLPRGGALATSRSRRALAELVREQALKRTREEVPHSIEVQVEEVERREDELTIVRAVLWVETESQKGILIGARREHDARRSAPARARRWSASSDGACTWT